MTQKPMASNVFVGALASIFLITAVIIAASLPLFPVDETRYLSVAWDMRETGNPFLLRLNTEPYSHKPPLLFWLINMSWTVFGTSIYAARVIPIISAAASIIMTGMLARAMLPQRREIWLLASALLLSLPPMMLYAPLILFDLMLTGWVLGSLYFIWRASRGETLRNWLLAGLCIGGALLAKGPVVLLHVAFVALLYPLWREKSESSPSSKRWYGGFILGLLVGAACILSWAIPAAISGGPEFARMLFWGQSAGRMVKSFDHARSFWFYIPIILGYCLPLVVWPRVWRGALDIKSRGLSSQEKFLISWLIPALACFMMISGKQPHYLLPLLPGICILAALWIKNVAPRPRDIWPLMGAYALLYGVITAAPLVIGHFVADPVSNVTRDGVGSLSAPVFAASGLAILGALYATRDTVEKQVLVFCAASGLLLSLIAVQGRTHIFPYYDLRPLAAAVQPYKDGPILYVRNYQGELGFLAKMHHKIDVGDRNDIAPWLSAHPDGKVVIRYGHEEEIAGYDVLYTQPYRDNRFYSIIALPGEWP